MAKEKGRKLVAQNRKARHDYHIHDTYEAGHRAQRHRGEVPARGPGHPDRRVRHRRRRRGLAARRAHPRVQPRHLDQPHRPAHPQAAAAPHGDRQDRPRAGRPRARTLVPLAIYFSDGYAKVEIALATGKREYDKRQTIAAARGRSARRERALAARNRGGADERRSHAARLRARGWPPWRAAGRRWPRGLAGATPGVRRPATRSTPSTIDYEMRPERRAAGQGDHRLAVRRRLGPARHRALLRHPRAVRRRAGRGLRRSQHRRSTSPDPGVATQFSEHDRRDQGGREEQLRIRIGDPGRDDLAPTRRRT